MQHAKARVTKNISEQVDGGEELQQSALLAEEILRPVTKVSEKGAALFEESVLEKKRKKYKIFRQEERKDKDAVTAKASREARAREKNKVVSGEKTDAGKEKNKVVFSVYPKNEKVKQHL